MKKIAALALAIALMAGSSVTPSSAQKSTKSYNEAYVDKITKINDRIRRKQIAAECKAEAKKTHSAIHFQKRRSFMKECVARNTP